MLSSLEASLGVVAPMAVLIALGVLIRRLGLVSREDMAPLDRLIFKLFMPLMLFRNVYDMDLRHSFSGEHMAYVLLGVSLTFLLGLYLVRRLPDRRQAGAIAQAVVRPNCVLFGVAAAEALYGAGNAGISAMVGAIAVPLTNVFAVVVLEMSRESRPDGKKILLAVAKNPLILAAALGLVLNGMAVPLPSLAYDAVKSLGGVTTTLSFLSLGVSLSAGEMRANRRPLALGILLRMVLIPLVLLPPAVLLGFRDQRLFSLVTLFAAPAAVTSYPMAVAYDADGPLAGQLVCFTSLAAVFTIFFCTFILRALGYL